jgi:hypothetical protein
MGSQTFILREYNVFGEKRVFKSTKEIYETANR